jgi:hypothetical protein
MTSTKRPKKRKGSQPTQHRWGFAAVATGLYGAVHSCAGTLWELSVNYTKKIRYKVLHFGFRGSNLVNVTTLENTTSRSILQELRISKRIPKTRIEVAKAFPKVKDLAVY